MCLWHIIQTCQRYIEVHRFDDPSSGPPSGLTAFRATLQSKVVISFLLFCFGFLFMFFTSTLYFFHIFLIGKGVTTNEQLKYTFPHGAPHSEGVVRNCINLLCRIPPPKSRLKRAYKLNARTELGAHNAPAAAGGGPESTQMMMGAAHSSGVPPQQRRAGAGGGNEYSQSRDSSSTRSSQQQHQHAPALDPERFAFHPLASSHRFHGSELEPPSNAAASASSSSSSSSYLANARKHQNWLSNKTTPEDNAVLRVVSANEMQRRERIFKENRQKNMGDVPQEAQPVGAVGRKMMLPLASAMRSSPPPPPPLALTLQQNPYLEALGTPANGAHTPAAQ